jgi:hypothetical protein
MRNVLIDKTPRVMTIIIWRFSNQSHNTTVRAHRRTIYFISVDTYQKQLLLDKQSNRTGQLYRMYVLLLRNNSTERRQVHVTRTCQIWLAIRLINMQPLCRRIGIQALHNTNRRLTSYAVTFWLGQFTPAKAR